MEKSMADLGLQIKILRNQASLSQEQLSEKTGIERAQISRIEKGQIKGVQFITIAKLYEALGLSLVPQKATDVLPMHPFVKWAGGKTQLLEKIEEKMPKEFNTYFEPFVGGGALLFNVQPKKSIINDLNSELVLAYQCFTDNESYKRLIEILKKHEENHSEEYFYQIRMLDQEPDFKMLSREERAGRMIYLNKSCFNGLYRVNSKGFFNVPSGKKKTVNCFDEKNFENIHSFFENSSCTILNTDFEKAVKSARAGDFVYFDPPYDTIENKNSFTSYGKDDFGKQEQVRLALLFKKLTDKGVFVMLSNHNTAFIRELYKDHHIYIVPAKRMINSKASGRGDVEEVLVTNYE